MSFTGNPGYKALRNEEHISLDDLMDELFYAEFPESGNNIQEILPTSLSDDERQLLTWYFEQDLSFEEIADQLGITYSACKKRVSRAVQHCRDILT